MSFLVVPAIVALIAKLFVLILSRAANTTSKVFVPLMVLFALHNLCEILIFWEFFQEIQGGMVLRAYYMLTILGWAAIALYAMEVAEFNQKLIKMSIIAVAVVFGAVAQFSYLVVADSTLLNYSITASRGILYVVWQFYCLAMGLFTVFVLVKGYLSAQNHVREIQCVFAGLALAPTFIVSVSVLAMMALGWQVNAVIAIPIATTLFVVIMLASEYQHKLTDVRRFIPWSNERQTSQKIMDIFSEYSRDDLNYRDAVSEIERLLVLQKYDKNEGNASETAGRMGMPRSSLYSIFNRLNIESRGDQKS